MAKTLVRLPSEYLRGISPDALAGFQQLRAGVVKAGPLDKTTGELIVITGLASAGYEDPFKVHSRRLLEGGTSKEILQHAILFMLCSTATLFQVARALQWIDDICDEMASIASARPLR